MINSIEEIVKKNIEQFEDKDGKPHAPCRCCSKCCDRVICVTQDEIQMVKKYLQEHPDLEKRIRDILKMVPQNADICPFLDPTTTSTHRCLLYDTPVRFHICVIFSCDYNSDYAYKKEIWLKMNDELGNPVENIDLRATFFDGEEDWAPDVVRRAKAYRDIF